VAESFRFSAVRQAIFWGLVVLAGLGASLALAGGGGRDALPRSTADRADERTGSQVHFIYALASDGRDRHLDTNGTLEHSINGFQHWLRLQTGGRGLRFDTSGGKLDITFVRLRRTDAQIAARGVFVRNEIEKELYGFGFHKPHKLYAVYYDGTAHTSCGGAPFPGTVTAMYLHGLPNSTFACDKNPWGRPGHIGYLEFSMLHEILHALGYSPACGKNYNPVGHTKDRNDDVMYQGEAPWRPAVLDPGHDDYYKTHIAGCKDLSHDPYLE